MVPFEVIKATGERETFQLQKLENSLKNAGAQPSVIQSVIDKLEENDYFRDGITTKKIYKEAYRLLKQRSSKVAGRYKLKEALLELGPSGYPFEKLIAELFKKLGYDAQVGQIVEGLCVSHEVDVIAHNGREYFMMECKFHNRQNYRGGVTVPLYVRSRFVDIKKAWNKLPGHKNKDHVGWLITNTRFTSDALEYSNCVGLRLLSWDYPKNKSLKDLISQTNLHPVTCLSTISKSEKQLLLEQDVILALQIYQNKNLLHQLGFDKLKADRIHQEAADICNNQKEW